MKNESMVKKLRNPVRKAMFCLGRVAGRATVTALVCLNLAATLNAQTSNCYRCPQGVAPPGAIGSQQLQRGGPLISSYQPVEIRAPQGVSVSLAVEGGFESPQPVPQRVGMLVGPLYRLRVTNIPFAPGVEVFPTVEIVDRLCPPPGQELKFPIPVELTNEELQMAADGKFVTRVIYVENPHTAVPAADDEKHQSWFDVGPGQNPLAVARELGRPVAVVRLGGRLPQAGGEFDMDFLCGCPPFVSFGPGESVQSPSPLMQQQQQLYSNAFIANRPYKIVSPSQTTQSVATDLNGNSARVDNPPVAPIELPAARSEEPGPTGVKTLPPPPGVLK